MYVNVLRQLGHTAETHPIMCREMELTSWTITHVYFANMGGIKINDRIVPAYYLANTLSITADTCDAMPAGMMTIIRLTQAEIEDKSKADTLVRLLWI